MRQLDGEVIREAKGGIYAGRMGSSRAPRRASAAAGTGELALIETIRARAMRGAKNSAVRLGIGDDCAVLAVPAGHEMLVTTDFSLEGRHFRRDWHPARSIGHRTLARGLSDLAAMGAEPMAACLSLALPASVARNRAWVRGFLDGFVGLAERFGVTLAGGDTCEAMGELVLADVVLVGSAATGTALRRSGARVGDLLYSTGWMGGATQEQLQLELGPRWYRKAKAGDGRFPHLFPEPRIAQGLALRERGLATACMDLSDGLSTDLARLCGASGVAAEVELDALPDDPRLRGADGEYTYRCVVHGGEDYELLFTAAPETKVPKRLLGVKVTQIGRIVTARARQPQMMLVGSGGERRPLESAGWVYPL